MVYLVAETNGHPSTVEIDTLQVSATDAYDYVMIEFLPPAPTLPDGWRMMEAGDGQLEARDTEPTAYEDAIDALIANRV